MAVTSVTPAFQPADVLDQAAREVPAELLGSKWLRELVVTMTEVMRAAPGVGRAAPQIGEPWRVRGGLPCSVARSP